ncbi:hypothetical protein AVEN_68445-1 [Araneus ventricosus]|uniref:Secreted protein n=1 Tax=Araneus ventricosus TaxID=182803 RepID=A0A4Y2MW47_ARAVE|nr:hypothetical protein AVEN_68445-1 [Araneus ventricosus]
MWRTKTAIILLLVISFIFSTEQAYQRTSSRSHAINKSPLSYVWEFRSVRSYVWRTAASFLQKNFPNIILNPFRIVLSP